MRFRTIDAAELACLCPAHFVRDFPADGLKPPGMLITCMRAGTCLCYGLYDGSALKRMQIAVYDRVDSWDYHFPDALQAAKDPCPRTPGQGSFFGIHCACRSTNATSSASETQRRTPVP